MSHMAPELLRCGRQSPAADVYAFGIVMWEVAAGTSAFDGMHYIEVISKVALKGQRPQLPAPVAEVMGQDFISLMEDCWAGLPIQAAQVSGMCASACMPCSWRQACMGRQQTSRWRRPMHPAGNSAVQRRSLVRAMRCHRATPSCAAAAAGSKQAATSL